MDVGLDRGPRGSCIIVPDYSFWFNPAVFNVLKVVLNTHSPVYYWGHLVVSLSVLSPCDLAAAADDMCHGLCMLNAQAASEILHSVVDLVCHCPEAESLLLNYHDQSLGVCSDVAFIEPLTCAGHIRDFWHTFVPGAMQKLLIPGCCFIWLFPGGYEVLALSHQRVIFCFPADIGLQTLLFLAHNIFDAVQTSFSLHPVGV